jgi:hypothetical protein
VVDVENIAELRILYIPPGEMGRCTTYFPSFAHVFVVVVDRNAQSQVVSWQSPAISSGV